MMFFCAFPILSFNIIYNIGLVMMASEKVYIARMTPSVSPVSTPIYGDITKIFDGDTTTYITFHPSHLTLTFDIDLGGAIPVNTLELSKLSQYFFSFSYCICYI